LNVFSHLLPHSSELMRFSAFQFTNEASGHLNHEPDPPVHAVQAAGLAGYRDALVPWQTST